MPSTTTTTTSSSEEEDLPLSSEQIATYLKDGILVVDNLLTPHEIHDAQLGLVSTLNEEYGVNVHDLEDTGYRLMDASSTFGAGTLHAYINGIIAMSMYVCCQGQAHKMCT